MVHLLFRLIMPVTLSVVLSIFGGTLWAEVPMEKSGIPAKIAADYIHAVIEADRTIYSEYIVDRLNKKRSLPATEHWEKEDTLPLPAQFLSLSSQISRSQGIGMNYRLTSLWPINENNKPKTDFAARGLQSILKQPDQPFNWVVQTEGQWYYQVIYPDFAVTESCVSCHNSHPKSPKNDFKVGDVMGGIIINIPLGKHGSKKAKKALLIPPEIVADYVHAVLDSDRTVYSKYVVDRLQMKNILNASETWWKDDSLLLPAQFLLNASHLIQKKNLGIDFRLISLWPINSNNGGANEFERFGLESVAIHPIRPYIGKTKMGRKWYFQAIYPDFAVTPACIFCHNSHRNSPKRDFELFDVMGGIVVTLPLN